MCRNLSITFICLIFFSFAYSQSTIYVAKKGYSFALNEMDYNEMMNAITTKDNQYFQKMHEQGKIITLSRDVEVNLLDSSWSGRVILRIRGKDIKLWGIRESIQEKY